MILAIDIGNSNIVVGILDEGEILFVERLSTNRQKTELEYAIDLENILRLHSLAPADIAGGILTSVVPPISETVRRSAEKILGKNILLVSPAMDTGLRFLVERPESLGSDRIVDSVGAVSQYPLPLILFDMGTATTVSAIDREGNYLGGIISPGVRVALESLTLHTAQLPGISLEAPPRAIGTNTIDSMKSGIIYGTAALVDGLIRRLKKEVGEDASVVATGGLARFILPYCRTPIHYDENLLMKGLWQLYLNNQDRAQSPAAADIFLPNK